MTSAPGLTEGSVFGPFEIRGRLGRGGMGVVYRAFDRRHHGEVALKLLADQVAGDEVFSERFRREARAAFELRNPYVVPVHDFGEIDERLYISMQLVDGRDLAAILADGPLAPARAAAIVRQAAHALDAAHRAALIHRDVKPSNLLILESHDDFTYLVDFGIAHVVGKHTVATSLTSTGATIGTLAYIAPERLSAERTIDGRVDVYALTCVLFQMLTGRLPYPQTDQPGLIAAHLFAPVPAVTGLRSDLPTGWDAVVARGMAKDPDDRYPTAQALAEDARRVLDGLALAGVSGQPVPSGAATAAPATEVPPGPSWFAGAPGAGSPPSGAPVAGPYPAGAHASAGAPLTQVPAQPGPPPGGPQWGTPYGHAPQWGPQWGAPPPGGTHPGPPATAPRPRRNPGGIVAVAVGLVAALVAGGVVWLVGQGSGNADSPRIDAAAPPSATAPLAPAAVTPSPTASSPPLNSGSALPPVQPQSTGDLGLSRPLTTVPCSGQYALVVGSSTDPAAYRTQVQAFLDRFPGSSYLLSEQNCDSLRHFMPDGSSIYSVYYGPYSSLTEACTAKARAGGDSYLRRLDDSTPVGAEPAC